MKYYTKEWFILMQKLDYTSDVMVIEDNDRKYSNDEVNHLIETKWKKDIESYEDLTKKEEHDLMIYYKEKLMSFFNSDHDKHLHIPKWLFEELDTRLIGCRVYPRSIYNKLVYEEKNNKNEFDQIELAASKELSEQAIPTEYREILELHDANIIKIENHHDEGIVLSLSGVFNEYHSSDYIKILFTGNSKIITNELGDIETYIDDEGLVTSDCIYLYHEIWNDKSGYRLDVLCDKGYFDLAYLSIQFEKLEII